MNHLHLHSRFTPAIATFTLTAITLALVITTPGHAAQPAASDTNAITVMAFNLRYASDQPPNAWSDRRPVVRDCIREAAPDVIGTQEGVYQQVKDIATDLPEYDWIGLGRDGGSRGEFMAVYYLRDRFEPLEYDHFWLSDTPEVIASTTWGHSNRRMVTWVKFRDLQADREFYFWNTHFDHQIQPAREKSAELVLQRVKELNTTLPVLLVGDFNATAGRNPAYETLVNDQAFVDTWNTATERRGDLVKTFHGYRGPTPGDDRIDWILARGPVTCEATEIITFHRDNQYPSDHFPVVAWLRWLP
jgi:endonuclease/exonuclease/phosphatase family metal-dependent hydrolase